jgi:hypothetical protein
MRESTLLEYILNCIPKKKMTGIFLTLTEHRYFSAFCRRFRLLSLKAKSSDWFFDKFRSWIRSLRYAWDIRWGCVEETDGENYRSLRKSMNKIQEVQWPIWSGWVTNESQHISCVIKLDGYGHDLNINRHTQWCTKTYKAREEQVADPPPPSYCNINPK